MTRPATAVDLSMIFTAEQAYMRTIEPTSEEGWLRARGANLALWTANLDRTTILEIEATFAGYIMWTATGGTATIISINATPAHRRRGLGLMLLNIFIDTASTTCTQLRLGVHRDNPARSLYPRAGFGSSATTVTIYCSGARPAARWGRRSRTTTAQGSAQPGGCEP